MSHLIYLDWSLEFRNPPARYRPMPLWVWNGQMSEHRIREMLAQLAEQGMGGVFVHPRAGLLTEYLSEEWFGLWEYALRECEKLGLECHLYDENSFPSGFGGGHVISDNPYLAGTSLVRRILLQPPGSGGGLIEGVSLAAFCVSPAGDFLGPANEVDITNASPQHPVCIFDLRQEAASWWHAGFPYVDLMRSETTKAFLASTHEKYRHRFQGSFGTTIKYVFTDEPTLEKYRGIPFSRFLLQEFAARNGYRLEANLASLCFDLPDAAKVRFDYFRTLDRLFTQNFVRRMHDWCGSHGLELTGHFNEHAWPKPEGTPSNMSALRWMQAPGNDLLAFQFTPSSLDKNALYFLNLKELSSVANQTGRARVLAESSGGGGYEATPRDFKPLEDFLLVNGVNLLSPHLCHETLAGTRKYDWPQTLSDHSPWWPASRPHQDHLSRCVVALTRGREFNRILVLHPDTTAWVRWKFVEEPHVENPCEGLRLSQQNLLLALSRRGIDYDLGCEMILEEMGEVSESFLCCGERSYELVVIPPGTEVLLSSTLGLLRRFLAAGGTVISSQAFPCIVDGEPSDAVHLLAEEFSGSWLQAADFSSMAELAASTVAPRIRVDSPSHPDLLWRRCEMPDGSVVFFFANPWDRSFEGRVEIEGKSLLRLDSATGEISAVPTEATKNGQAFPLSLGIRGHELFLASVVPGMESPIVPVSWSPVVLSGPKVTRLAENRVVLDYCDLEAGGVAYAGISTARADKLNWPAQGWSRNPWSFSIQFKRALLETNPSPDSGFLTRFRFRVSAAEDVRKTLRLAMERPRLYRVKINGCDLEFAEARQWFDEEILAVEIGHLVKEGDNVIELLAKPFDILCEIAPVYILGNFSLRASSPGFEITGPQALKEGDWTLQGHPFYPDWMRYEWSFFLSSPCDALKVILEDWKGAAARVRIDEMDVVSLVQEPFVSLCRGPFSAGSHRLSIDVAGNLRNQMGPHFQDGVPLPWDWEKCPSSPPDGRDYRFAPSGLRRASMQRQH